jgi:hypothetical protein
LNTLSSNLRGCELRALLLSNVMPVDKLRPRDKSVKLLDKMTRDLARE